MAHERDHPRGASPCASPHKGKFVTSRLFKTILLLGAAGLAAPAFAQTAAPAPADASPQADTGDLGDIVVTAERRSENLQRVPISVAVVGGPELRGLQSGGGKGAGLAGTIGAAGADAGARPAGGSLPAGVRKATGVSARSKRT